MTQSQKDNDNSQSTATTYFLIGRLQQRGKRLVSPGHKQLVDVPEQQEPGAPQVAVETVLDGGELGHVEEVFIVQVKVPGVHLRQTLPLQHLRTLKYVKKCRGNRADLQQRLKGMVRIRLDLRIRMFSNVRKSKNKAGSLFKDVE